MPFPRPGRWRLRFNSDAQIYCEKFDGHLSTDVAVEPGGQDEGCAATGVTIGPYTVLIYSQDA